MIDFNTFWTQPAKGFTDKTRGRTEEEIQAEENIIGFKFPHSYRELMKLQNGGYMRRTTFFIDGTEHGLGFTMNEIPSDYYKNMRVWLEEGESEEEIQAHSKTGHCYPERLINISGMHGHEFMFLDYGWDQKDPKSEPEVCFMYHEFEEFMRLPSFDALLEKLTYYGHRCEGYIYGVNTQLPIVELANKFTADLGVDLIDKEDDKRYGWFNFEKWYFGNIDLEDGLSLKFYLSPNKYLSGTYIDQSKPDTKYILEVFPRIGKKRHLPSSTKYLQIINTFLEGFELKDSMEELFIPVDMTV